MTLSLDSYLGIHAKSLLVRDQRAAQLANNIANADTPNYKAMDINFNDVLAAQMTSGAQQISTTSNLHIDPNADFSGNLKYRIPTQLSFDGNTVDKDLETTEFAKNALNYQASLNFLDGKIRSMKLALKGD